ncbi:MAG: phosphoribosylformylglycinamidine cyclo-ligase [Chloroflexi bacterium]|nr:phosphoribosylformylglycinamidine cyclo-ligase [Chloroflexota bacterium]|tara:strand:- start:2954 stop:3967 length:1014 start_codon:yes stop_codon:yes gene_type:complete
MFSKNYKESGVDLEASENLKKQIGNILKKFKNHSSHIDGFFAGISEVNLNKSNLLASSVDGVGTKIKIAQMMGNLNFLGFDLVNHGVNDILPSGANPLFFMDYIACGEIKSKEIISIVSSLAKACHEVECVLLGGETAVMPGIYKNGDIDLVGFMVGQVNVDYMQDINLINQGDILIGFPSNGLHTNGYSLVRSIFNLDTDSSPLFEIVPETNSLLGELLILPHKNYMNILKPVRGVLKSLSHITGGGITGNLPRSIPENLGAQIEIDSWDTPKLFDFIMENGNIELEEMFNVFNMGIGMIAVIDQQYCEKIQKLIPDSIVMGKITSHSSDGKIKFK